MYTYIYKIKRRIKLFINCYRISYTTSYTCLYMLLAIASYTCLYMLASYSFLNMSIYASSLKLPIHVYIC